MNEKRHGPDAPLTLVTGADGFNGRHLTEYLHGLGHRVLATDILPSERSAVRNVAETYVQCDLSDPTAIQALVARHGPFRHVFHTAGLVALDAPYELLHLVNVGGTVNLMTALADNDPPPRRTVIWSSGSVYDLTRPGPFEESSPLKPLGNYPKSKLQAERSAYNVARDCVLDITILRPSGITARAADSDWPCRS